MTNYSALSDDEAAPDACAAVEVLDEPLVCSLPIANGLGVDEP